MIGHSVFTHTPTTENITAPYVKVTKKEYEDWKRQFTADALLGLRYGQSFCNFFNVTDNLLYYTGKNDWCDTYIKDHYIER